MEIHNANIIANMPEIHGQPADIMVIGVGGAGGNTVDQLHAQGIVGVNLVVCNTDINAVEKSPVEYKIVLGDGTGAGNDAKVGEEKAKASVDIIRNLFTTLHTKMLFIAAGMGGGTGTGVSPLIAQIASEMGILTVGIVTMPDPAEGPARVNQAQEGLDRLREYVDSIIVLDNRIIREMYGNEPLDEAFGKANKVVADAARGIAEIITIKAKIGTLKVNVDLSDVCKVMRKSGYAIMSISSAEGDECAREAVDKLFDGTSLFGGASIKGAQNVLINFSVSSREKLTQNIVYTALECIQERVAVTDGNGKTHRANIIWGTSIKEDLGDKLELIIIVTGFKAKHGDTEHAENIVSDKKTIPVASPHRFTSIEESKSIPAYVSLNVDFALPDGGSQVRRGTVVGDTTEAVETPVAVTAEMDFGGEQ